MASTNQPPKVSLYNTTELKNTLDDHLPLYLSSSTLPASSTPLPKLQRFTPSYTLTNVRLLFGYSAVLIAMYAFYLDWYLKVDFEEIKGFTFVSVCAYFLLNTVLTGWIWLVERGCIFQGSRIEGGKWGVRTLVVRSHAPSKKFEPVYKLEINWEWSGGQSRKGTKIDVESPFTRFFTSDSFFAPEQFEAWLQEQIPWLLAEGKGGAAGSAKPKTIRQSSIGWHGYAQGVKSNESKEDTIVVQSGAEKAGLSSDGDITTPRKRGRPKKGP